MGGGGNSATPQGAQQGSNLVYRVVSSRHPGSGHHPHVKKSDSSQQTDSSAFKHQQQPGLNSSSATNSSSNSQQWKKYIEAGAARDRERDKEGAPPSPSPSRRSQVNISCNRFTSPFRENSISLMNLLRIVRAIERINFNKLII